MTVHFNIEDLGDVGAIAVFDQTELNASCQGVAEMSTIAIRDVGQTRASFPLGKRVTVDIDGGANIYGGYLLHASRRFWYPVDDPFTLRRLWLLRVVSNDILFQKRIVHKVSDPETVTGPVYSSDTFDDVVLEELFDNWLDLTGDGIDTSSRIHQVATINAGQPVYPWNGGMTWGQAMAGIAMLPAAVWGLDPDWKVYYGDVDEADAPFGLSNEPNGTTFRSYREETIWDDLSLAANDYLAIGFGQGRAQGVWAREEAAASIAEHGRWQDATVNYAVWKQATIDRIADAAVNGSPSSKRGRKDPRVQVDLKTREPGLTVGMKLRIIDTNHGFDDVIPIRKMKITFPEGHPLYSLKASHEIDAQFMSTDPFPYRDITIPPYPIPEIPDITVEGGECDCGITDTFNRADGDPGTSDAGIAWFVDTSIGEPGGTIEIIDNYLRIANDGSDFIYSSMFLDFHRGAGFDIYFKFRHVSRSVSSELTYHSMGWGNNAWQIDDMDTTGRLGLFASGATSAFTTFMPALGDWYNVHWYYNPGVTHRIKFWPVDQGEPVAWTLGQDVAGANIEANEDGIYMDLSTEDGDAVEINYDELDLRAAPGASVDGTTTEYTFDSFNNRTISDGDGWGEASSGGDWMEVPGPSGGFGVGSGFATHDDSRVSIFMYDQMDPDILAAFEDADIFEIEGTFQFEFIPTHAAPSGAPDSSLLDIRLYDDSESFIHMESSVSTDFWKNGEETSAYGGYAGVGANADSGTPMFQTPLIDLEDWTTQIENEEHLMPVVWNTGTYGWKIRFERDLDRGGIYGTLLGTLGSGSANLIYQDVFFPRIFYRLWIQHNFSNGGGSTTDAPIVTYGPITVRAIENAGESAGGAAVNRCTESMIFDRFDREVTGGWGTSSLGYPWTTVGTLTTFSVNVTTGIMQMASGALLATATAVDGPWTQPSWTMTALIDFPTFTASHVLSVSYAVSKNGTAEYASVAIETESGFQLIRLNGETGSDTAAVTIVSGAVYWVKWEVTYGGATRAKVWNVSATEPDWQVEETVRAEEGEENHFIVSGLKGSGFAKTLQFESINFTYDGQPCYEDCGQDAGEYEVLDDFNRTDTVWGTPSSGGSPGWSPSVGAGDADSVDGDAGLLSTTSSGSLNTAQETLSLNTVDRLVRLPFWAKFTFDDLQADAADGDLFIQLNDSVASPNTLVLIFNPSINVSGGISALRTTLSGSWFANGWYDSGSPLTGAQEIVIHGDWDGCTVYAGGQTYFQPWRTSTGGLLTLTPRTLTQLTLGMSATNSKTSSLEISEIAFRDPTNWGTLCDDIVATEETIPLSGRYCEVLPFDDGLTYVTSARFVPGSEEVRVNGLRAYRVTISNPNGAYTVPTGNTTILFEDPLDADDDVYVCYDVDPGDDS